MSFKNIAGESKSVAEEIAAPWAETILPTILSRYPLKYIFNADEFGLMYQCLPDKTLQVERRKVLWGGGGGGGHSKVSASHRIGCWECL